MEVKDIISKYTNENGFRWGIDTAMEILAPRCLHQVKANSGDFEVTQWGPNWCDETQRYLEPPSSRDIRDEYVRLRTIAECVEYFSDTKTKESGS